MRVARAIEPVYSKGFYTDTPVKVLHEWLHERIGIPYSTDFRALGRVEGGDLIAVVGYEGFTGTACRMHMAGEGRRWITREFIRRAFNYPFVTLNLAMVFGIVPSGNTVALDIDLRLGFEELVYIPGAHPDGGIHFLQLTRANWLRTKYGQESTRSA